MSTRSYKLADLARLVEGSLVGDGSVEIRGVAGVREAVEGDITFIANSRYEGYAKSTSASALIAAPHVACGRPGIQSTDPYYAYLRVLELFAKDSAIVYPGGVHDAAVVHPSASLGRNVSIGPFCHVGADAVIGDDTTLVSGVFVGQGAELGMNCLIYANVTIREQCSLGNGVILHSGVVIGADGFGFAKNGQAHHKIPQIGRVVIEDDVEIGANSCVDRATTGATVIRRGTKIDNLVQVAHNVVIGEHSVIAAQVGISGSTEIGRNATFGGQAGVAGHVTLGDNVVVGGRGGVTKSVPANMIVSGFPAREHSVARKLWAYTAQLPALVARVRELEEAIEQLKQGTFDSSAENDK